MEKHSLPNVTLSIVSHLAIYNFDFQWSPGSLVTRETFHKIRLSLFKYLHICYLQCPPLKRFITGNKNLMLSLTCVAECTGLDRLRKNMTTSLPIMGLAFASRISAKPVYLITLICARTTHLPICLSADLAYLPN